MHQSIEELRAQRELIRKHLEWIDRKVAEAEAASNVTPTAAPQTKATSAAATRPARVPEPAIQMATTEPSDDSYAEPDPERLIAAPVQNDIKRATIGCLALFILSTALFLFLLFGLPYMLD